MTNRRARHAVASVLLAGLIGGGGLVACSDDAATADTSGIADTSPDVTICEPTGTAQAEDDLPQVAEIPIAIDALETELGGPQEFFEVNATARVVNLFVALNDGALVQPWVYLDGELTSEDGQEASGGTFSASDLDFAPSEVLSKVRDEVPDSILESFYVHGDGAGNVQYGVLTSAQCGGGLDVVVGPDGAVLSVDPVN
jgi:hypothetical protein